jgi:hypothetical protein
MTSTRVDKHPTAFTATGLPVLRVALNVKQMSARLAPLLEPLADSAPSAVAYAKLLAYKQGNRGTIRYEVTGLDPAVPAGPDARAGTVAVLGKLYPQAGQAQRVDAILRGLWGEAFTSRPQLGVPRPLGCVPELSMLVYLPVHGQLLDEVLAAGDRDAALQAVEWTAAWLATLHRAQLLLDRSFRLTSELLNLQAWAAMVAKAWPDQAAVASRLAADLRATAAGLELGGTSPIHKDFHYKHVLVGGGGVRVIDFDEVRLGAPAYDAAHFCVHLRLLATRTSGDPDALRAQEAAFLTAYTTNGGALTIAPFSWFAAYTCLKIAKQLCTVRGVRPRPDGEEQHRQVAVILAQGQAYRDAVG